MALALIAFCPHAGAEQFRTFGGYEVHYNAVRADFIPQEVAIRHGITRSASRGMVNITVLQQNAEGVKRTVPAEIVLNVESASGSMQSVRLKAVREDGAVNYIGEFRLSGAESYRFEAEVRPDDVERAYRVVWAQELYAEQR